MHRIIAATLAASVWVISAQAQTSPPALAQAIADNSGQTGCYGRMTYVALAETEGNTPQLLSY